jgi:hypothetical protein
LPKHWDRMLAKTPLADVTPAHERTPSGLAVLLRSLAPKHAFEPQIAAMYARIGLNGRQTEIRARATQKRDE